jgi:hypothetical protein
MDTNSPDSLFNADNLPRQGISRPTETPCYRLLQVCTLSAAGSPDDSGVREFGCGTAGARDPRQSNSHYLPVFLAPLISFVDVSQESPTYPPPVRTVFDVLR